MGPGESPCDSVRSARDHDLAGADEALQPGPLSGGDGTKLHLALEKVEARALQHEAHQRIVGAAAIIECLDTGISPARDFPDGLQNRLLEHRAAIDGLHRSDHAAPAVDRIKRALAPAILARELIDHAVELIDSGNASIIFASIKWHDHLQLTCYSNAATLPFRSKPH